MVGKKIYKENFNINDYAETAQWCNMYGCTIEDKGEYYEVVKIEVPLEVLKEQKVIELKSIRDKKELEPIYYDGEYFDFDEKSYNRITAAIYTLEQIGEEATIQWTTARNTKKEVSANDLKGVIAAAGARSNELHIKYRELREMVDVVPSKEELDNIVWR